MSQRRGREMSMLAKVGFYTSLGFILPSGILGGYLFGWWIDGWLHTAPVLGIIGAFAGGAAGFIEILRLLKRVEKNESGSDTDSGFGAR